MNPDSKLQPAAQSQTEQAVYLLCDAGSFLAMVLIAILALIVYLPLAFVQLSQKQVSLKANHSGGRP